MAEAHQKCVDAGYHICARPRRGQGRLCAENGCPNKAGTDWGPYWCPIHDKERIDRISWQFDMIRKGGNPNGITPPARTFIPLTRDGSRG